MFLRILVLISILFIYFSCKDSKINKNPIIKIENFEISEHELNHELNKLDNQSWQKQDVLKWKKEFLENCFLICDGYSKNYDTLSLINDEVDIVANLMMVQKYGYLWKKTVSPIVDEFMIVTKDKTEKRKKMFYFDYVILKNTDSTLLNFTINSIEDYNKLKSQSKKDLNIRTSYSSMQWPFSLFYNNSNELYAMTPGKISSPMKFKEDIFYFYLDHIEDITVPDNDKEILSGLLQWIKEEEINEKKTDEMLANGKPQLSEKEINDIVLYLKKGGNFYNYSNNPVLLKYQINNKVITLDYRVFIERLNKLPYKSVFNDSTQFVSEVYQYFYDDYLRNEALKLGLYSQEEFVLDKRNFKNKLLLNYYNQVHFNDSIKIDSLELQKYYSKNSLSFKISEGINLDIFTFKTTESADEYLKKLKGILSSNNDLSNLNVNSVQNLINYKTGYIQNTNNPDLPNDIINELEKLPDLSLLDKIVENNDLYMILFKRNAIHDYTKSFKSVSGEIYNKLFFEKFNELRSKRIEELKKKYPLKINKTGVTI